MKVADKPEPPASRSPLPQSRSPKLTAWLAEHACHRERHPERVREELLGHCRDELIEPPSANRIGRIISSALHQADMALALRISASIPPAAAARILALIAEASDDPGRDGNGREAFAFIKSDPGDVSLKTCEEEAAKLALLRHIGLPAGLFADVAPKVLAAWRARAAMEAPSHLREYQDPVKLTLLAALLYFRQREITDTLVDLLITTVHRINARAETRVVNEFVTELKRVAGKENILLEMTEAALGGPDRLVSEVIYPAVPGGAEALAALLQEYRTQGTGYRQHKQRVYRYIVRKTSVRQLGGGEAGEGVMSTTATPQATIKTFPRWASQLNGVSCQTLNHPNGHQTKANAETCQATRVRALTKASEVTPRTSLLRSSASPGFMSRPRLASVICQDHGTRGVATT